MKTKSGFTFAGENYKTRGARVKKLHAPDTFYASKFLMYASVLIFCAIDFSCQAIVWNLFQNEDWWLSYAISLGVVIALDVPLSIAGNAMKKYHHGVMSKREAHTILYLSVIVFTLAFICSFSFRLVTREISYSIDTQETLIKTSSSAATASADHGTSILVAAIFGGIIPLLTSISSYIMGYFSTNPIGEKLAKLELEKVKIESNILDAERDIARAGSICSYVTSSMARERAAYNAFVADLNCKCLTMQQIARLVLMKKLSSAYGIASVTESAKEIYERADHTFTPDNELETLIRNDITSDTDGSFAA